MIMMISLLDTFYGYLEEHTWVGRQIHKFFLYRDSHPAISMLFLPLDFIAITVFYVTPVVFAFLLGCFLAWPVKWLGGDDVTVAVFGLAELGLIYYFIKRWIKKKRNIE